MSAASQKVSAAMESALREAATGTLRRQRHGWSNRGFDGHSSGTVEALAKRGLLRIDRLAGCAGTATITKPGRSLLDRMEAQDG